MMRTQASSLLRAARAPARAQQVRQYATPAGGASSNLPLILGGLGVAGLAGYVYIDRNPSTKAAISANKNEALGRASDAVDNAKSTIHERGAALSANAHEMAGRASDKVEQAADAAKDKAGELKSKGESAAKEVQGAAQEKAATGEAGLGVVGALIKDKWVDFKLEKVEPYNHNTDIYTFSFPEADATAGGEVASALLVRASDAKALLDDKGKPVIRPYTPISSPDTKGHLTLMVKKYEGGKMSQYINHLNPGETLAFKGPISKFPYKPNQFDHGVCISGGSGITPMYQLISHAMGLPEDKTKFTLIFSNVTEKDILLRKEWDALAKQHGDRLKVVYALDKPGYFWKGETGYVSKEVVAKHAPKKEGEKVKFFVCGPPGQVNSIAGPKDGPRQGPLAGVLKELGYTEEEAFKF